MAKRDNHNTVNVRVGSDMRKWIVNAYGTDTIRLDKDMNLWCIIKQHLELLPDGYSGLDDPDEYIAFVLLTDGGNTRAYAGPDARHPYRQSYRVNTLYRCAISERGENIVRRFFKKQFKNCFHNYMRGALNNNPELSITEAITEFLTDAAWPDIDNRIISSLCKDWYRFRQKYPDSFMVPVFF